MAEKDFAYFDNAATSFPKPPGVLDFADAFYRTKGASAGRGQYSMAAEAGALIEEVRRKILNLLHCSNKQVLFTSSATEALNKILLGLLLPENAVVYLSPFEHNAVTRVVAALERISCISVKMLPFDKETFLLDTNKLISMFESTPPSLVVTTHASNVCGAILPVETICTIAKRYSATTVIDMSQTAGLIDIDLSTDNVDFAVFAGHKTLLAPFGVGGFICSRNLNLSPIEFGGTGSDSAHQGVPDSLRSRIEIGSHNTYALAGLSASLDWLSELGLARVWEREVTNRNRLLEILRSFNNISIMGEQMLCSSTGIISVIFKSYTSDEIGKVLNDVGVAVRSGLQCSPYAHSFLGTLPGGTIRFSTGCLNTESDFLQLEKGLHFINQNS